MPMIYIATVIACVVSLALGTVVAMEDAEVWGQLQWFGYTLACTVLGAIMQRSISLLCSNKEV